MAAKETFAARLRRLRIQNKLSLRKLAKILGTTSVTLCRYELGEREVKIERLKKIAECFDVSADYLIGLTDDENE